MNIAERYLITLSHRGRDGEGETGITSFIQVPSQKFYGILGCIFAREEDQISGEGRTS